jgi:hypothetical protein
MYVLFLIYIMHVILAMLTQPIGPLGAMRDDPQDSCIPIADQDPSVCAVYSLAIFLTPFQFTVWAIPVASKATTPHVNLVPQRGTVPRPPLTATSSGNVSLSRTQVTLVLKNSSPL